MVSQRIIVGVDGSRASLTAVEWAVARAQHTGATVHLMCVYTVATYATYGFEGVITGFDPETLQRGAQKVVDTALGYAQSVLAGQSLDITTEVIAGDPASVLVDKSKEAELIVIGTEHHGQFFSRIFGTVSSTLPAYSACPVVVVPNYEEGRSFTPVERVVVGVEATEKLSKALCTAVEETALWGGQLTAISAIPLPAVNGVMTWVPNAVDHDVLMTEMKRQLNTAVDTAIEDRDMQVRRHVIDGAPAQLLVEFSTAVDLVVVGSRGYSALTQAVLGVTSQAVLAHSSCPVMVVPHHNDRHDSMAFSWGRAK